MSPFRAALLLVPLLCAVEIAAQQPSAVPSDKALGLLEQSIIKRFPEADTDKNGRISGPEAKALQAKLRGKGLKDAALAPPPTEANARYGPHERNVLDFWKAGSTEPTPLLVYIHGGGFLVGDKSDLAPQVVLLILANRISFASINYRYTSQAIYPAPMQDGARAIQFLRSKAREWNIDPNRIAAFGGSAGAGISMWIGFHDDLANPQSSDPVERESSRLACIGTMGGQGTYDPLVIKEWIGEAAARHRGLFALYGAQTFEDFSKPEIRKLATDAAAMTHLTKDDPPLFMVYSEADAPLPANAPAGAGIHHPIFGHKLKERMDALGIECVYRHTTDGRQPAPAAAMLDWFVEKLARKP